MSFAKYIIIDKKQSNMSRKRKTENIQMLNSILSDNMPDKRRKIHFDKNVGVMTQNSIQNFQKLKLL